jgi:hypothetical protein
VALDSTERLRFYLRDREREVFRDDEIDLLLADTASFEAAVSLGWLLKAASAPDSPMSAQFGQVQEQYGSTTDSYAVAMGQYNYWRRQAGDGVAQWFELEPGDDSTLVGYLRSINQYLEDNDMSYNPVKGL